MSGPGCPSRVDTAMVGDEVAARRVEVSDASGSLPSRAFPGVTTLQRLRRFAPLGCAGKEAHHP